MRRCKCSRSTVAAFLQVAGIASIEGFVAMCVCLNRPNSVAPAHPGCCLQQVCNLLIPLRCTQEAKAGLAASYLVACWSLDQACCGAGKRLSEILTGDPRRKKLAIDKFQDSVQKLRASGSAGVLQNMWKSKAVRCDLIETYRG